MAGASWKKDVEEFRAAGFSDEEISQEETRLRKEMSDAGFAGPEVESYFGMKEPDMAPIRDLVKANLEKGAATPEDPTAPKRADGFLSSIEAGWQISVSGLIARGQKPDVIMPEDAPTFYRIASQVASIAGDVPAMIAGAMAGAPVGTAGGAAAGSVVPVLGTAAGGVAGGVFGAGAGANALPTAIRETLMSYYEKGEIKDFSDFWERATPVFLDTLKSGVVGGVSMGVGAKVSKVLAPVATPLLKGTAATSSEIATMVTVGRALEGEVPKAQDFTDAAILVAGISGSTKVAGKLRRVYSKTGMKPSEVVQEAMHDPVLRQDLLASGDDIPAAFKSMEDGPQPSVEGGMAQEVPAPRKIDPELTERSSVLMDGEADAPQLRPKEPKPEPEKVELPPRELSPEDQAIQDRIAKSSDQAKPAYSWNQFYTEIVDRTHPFKMFTDALSEGKALPADKNPYYAARSIPGVPRMVEQFIKHSPFEFATKKNVGKSLESIIEPLKDDIDGLERYMVSSRAVELDARGIKSGIPLPEAKAVIAKGSAKYEKAFREIVEFQNHALNYLKDSGVLSEKSYAQMVEANQNYVPFFRLMEDGPSGAKGSGKGLAVKNPVKGIKGSDKQVIRPMESIVRNLELYVTLAERNRVGRTMVELAESNPTVGKQLMERVPTELRPVEVKAAELTRALEEQGVLVTRKSFEREMKKKGLKLSEEQIDQALKNEKFDDPLTEAITIFRPENIQLAPDEIQVYRKGKREIYRVAPEVADAIKNMDAGTTGIFVKMLAAPAKLLRAGTVLTPDFAFRNFMRDQVTAFANSKYGYIPFATAVQSVGHLIKKDDVYQNWLKSGGANAAMKGIDSYIEGDIYKLSKQTGLIDKTWNVVKTPVEAMAAVTELLENVTRLGEFKKVAGAKPGAREMMAAGYASREITVDMARIGAKTKALNQIIAFWNIGGVQGIDRTIRQFKEKPLGTSARLMAAVTLPSVLLWWANKDDPRWKEIPRWQKDLFWIVMTDDHVYRIPKPHAEGLLFGSLPERTMEAFFEQNPKAYKEFTETLAGSFTPGFMPTAVQPMLEHSFNRSMFMGNKIVPSNLEKVLPEYQYNEYTTEAGKILGKMVATVPGMRESSFASPMVIENYIRSWSGNLGIYALKMADQALYKSGVVPEPVKPASTLADIPFVKAFVIRHPSASAQSIQDFYDKYGQQKQVVDTIRHLARTGDFKNMERELKLQANQDKLLSLDGVREALNNQSKFIQLVNRNPNIKPEEKRQIIDGAYMQMIETAKFGNRVVAELEKSTR